MQILCVLLVGILTLSGLINANLGPPYLYVTMHGGEDKGAVNQVYIYSRAGHALGEALEEKTDLNELRGMVLWGDSMLLANANRKNSFVAQFQGACLETEKMKQMRVIVPKDTPGIDHPYGVTTDNSRFLYVSTQGTNAVYRFYLTTGESGPIAPALAAQGAKQDDFPGLFAQFDPESDGTRGITWHPGRKLLFVANKDIGVVALNEDGYVKGILDADEPIAVSYCPARDSIFVSSKGDDSVSEWNPHSLKRMKKWTSHLLAHPAGLACFEGSVFVVSQDEGTILEIDLEGGKVRVLVEDLPDKGEQIILSHAQSC
ncbi:Six-bladed beta-propeller TolB-like protein [Nannochloropsis gaditana]|uniref:Six-bladed beta-propeller TolB-like protein n=1 Tax=Nannochloropsis gaditana TaxID=72520 RepID=W7U3G8_9STRA|nr:Six-bladed beta-propeller TolB-like protein [Nannochloropsis gaditana]